MREAITWMFATVGIVTIAATLIGLAFTIVKTSQDVERVLEILEEDEEEKS